MGHQAISPAFAAVLSGIMPGLGHWFIGYRRRGAILLAVAVFAGVPLVLVAVLLFFGGGVKGALEIARPFFEHPAYLLILLIANLAVLVFRAFAALDAFWLAGGGFRRGRVWALGIAVILLGAIVATPHAWAAQRNFALYDLLTHDFSADPDQPLSADTTTTSSVAPSTTTTASTPPEASTSSTSSSTTTTTTAPPPERINVLLLGGDAGPDRPGLRTDTIIVVSVDPATDDAAMFQLPRNQVDLPIPPGHPAYDVWDCHCYPELANTIYQYGLQHPELFPGGSNAGAQAVMDLVGHLFDLEIHQYVLVDLLGFVNVIDALGGLTITVTSLVEDEQYTRPGGDEVPVEYQPGTYEMDGEEVLAFARVRRGSDDYHRMGRQRCVLEALASQSSPFTLLRALPTLSPALQESILTDIPVADWPDYIELAARVDTAAIVSVRFMPRAPELVGTGTSYVIKNPQGYWIPNVELIRATITTILGSPTEAPELLGITPLAEVCGTE